MTAPTVVYAVEPTLDASEFRGVLIDSGLGSIRPVDDLPRLHAMLSAAQLLVTARLDQPDRPLVGVARTITDFAWCAYLSDLAVVRSAQGLGIGKGLLDATRAHLGPRVALVLSSVPEAVAFYERVQMERIADAFWYRRSR
ncbi:MAG TPA: GNAT family N-acetyltransferase [Burkholderiaceae bacterium]|nr:GNAT family N-acetyltransferase [Burkholderiaceae bacterium]